MISKQQKYRRLRAEQGLCVQCGAVPSAPHFRLCPTCREKHRTACRNRYRIARGLPLDGPLHARRPRTAGEVEP